METIPVSLKILALLAITSFSLNLQAFDFDRSLTPNERLTIERDLDNLCRLNYNLPFANKQSLERRLRELMGIDAITCEQLQTFLRERIQVILKELAGDNIFLDMDEGDVDSPTLREVNWVLSLAHENLRVIRNGGYASSLGGTLYIRLKSPLRERFLAPELAAQDLGFGFRYTTPRGESKTLPIQAHQNIIQVADKFFLSPTHPNNHQQFAIANSLYRIGVLLHEVHHSVDELRFQHVPCQYSDQLCDDVHDDPHTLGSLFLHYAWNLCALSHQCSAQELVNLNARTWEMLRHINHLDMVLEEPRIAIQYLLSEPTDCVILEPPAKTAIDHPAIQELFLGRPLANTELVATLLAQALPPDVSFPPDEIVSELTELINMNPETATIIILKSLIDLRGTQALPFDEHFIATTVEALDYVRRDLLLSRILQALALWERAGDHTMTERLQAVVYEHSYDDEWKSQLKSQLANSPQWREALGSEASCTPSL